MLAYLDQNVLGYIRDGVFRAPEIQDVTWVYSAEHFDEISRGNDTSFLSVVKDLKAQEIEVVSDNRFRMQDRAILRDCVCPLERYEQHLENVGGLSVDDTILTDLIARLWGADNYADIQTLPDRIGAQLEALLPRGHELESAAKDLKWALAELVEQLKETRSLESVRQQLGIAPGSFSDLRPDNAIPQIWDSIKDHCAGLTCDQFFGAGTVGERVLSKTPTFLEIVAYHATLNFVGYRPDKKLSRPSDTSKIVSDGRHIAYGAFCHLLISADSRLCEKASAIYKVLSVGTLVARFTPH